MSAKVELSFIQEASRSLCDSLELKHCLSNLVDILKKSVQADIGGIIISDGKSPIIVCSGVTAKEEPRLYDVLKNDGQPLAARLNDWWPGNLVCYELNDSNEDIIFAGKRDHHKFTARESAFFETIAEFTIIATVRSLLRRNAEHQLLAEERERIACELHDGLAQSIYSMALNIKTSRRLLVIDVAEADAKLAKLEQLAAVQIEDIRGYMRALKDNKSISIDLPTVVKKHTRQFCALHGLRLGLKTSGGKVVLSREINDNLYYVICEALANTARHARASTVKINLVYEEAELALGIEDDGCGFDVAGLRLRRRGMGLENIENRIRRIGGNVTIQSRPGQGTRIIAFVPYEHAVSGSVLNDKSFAGR